LHPSQICSCIAATTAHMSSSSCTARCCAHTPANGRASATCTARCCAHCPATVHVSFTCSAGGVAACCERCCQLSPAASCRHAVQNHHHDTHNTCSVNLTQTHHRASRKAAPPPPHTHTTPPMPLPAPYLCSDIRRAGFAHPAQRGAASQLHQHRPQVGRDGVTDLAAVRDARRIRRAGTATPAAAISAAAGRAAPPCSVCARRHRLPAGRPRWACLASTTALQPRPASPRSQSTAAAATAAMPKDFTGAPRLSQAGQGMHSWHTAHTSSPAWRLWNRCCTCSATLAAGVADPAEPASNRAGHSNSCWRAATTGHASAKQSRRTAMLGHPSQPAASPPSTSLHTLSTSAQAVWCSSRAQASMMSTLGMPGAASACQSRGASPRHTRTAPSAPRR